MEGRRFFSVGWIDVSKRMRRTGIATRLYERAALAACRLGKPLASDVVRKPGAQGFWAKQERKGRATRFKQRFVLHCPVPKTLNGW